MLEFVDLGGVRKELLEAYREYGSYELAGDLSGTSAMTVWREVGSAVQEGLVSEEVRGKQGRPRFDRSEVLTILDMFPWLTSAQVAMRLGCSEATVYRAKRGE